MNDEFNLFNMLVARINDENKNDFFSNLNDYLTRIKEMFYFILENICSFEKDAIEMSYFKFEYDGAHNDLDAITKKSIGKVQSLLDEMKNIIFEDFSHNELLNKRKRKKRTIKEKELNELTQNLTIDPKHQHQNIAQRQSFLDSTVY